MSRYFELSSRRRAADGVQLGAPPQRSSFWRRWTQADGTLLIGRGLPSTPLSLQPPLSPDFIANISLQALTFAKPCNAGHLAGKSLIAAASRINGCWGGRGERRQCAVAREVGSRIGGTGCGGGGRGGGERVRSRMAGACVLPDHKMRISWSSDPFPKNISTQQPDCRACQITNPICTFQ